MGGGGSNIYTPSNQDLATQSGNLQGIIGQNLQATQGYAPNISQQAQSFQQQVANNPYQPAAQAGAGVAGVYGTGTVAPLQAGMGLNLSGLGNLNAGYAPQALQTGFDPQNALYNRNFQQTMDQTNALNAMSGVSNTPYGASVAGNVGNNFNLDWANQALQRQQTGAQTAGQLSSTAGGAYTDASQQLANALNTYTTASALPSTTYVNNLLQQLAALGGTNQVVGGATNINNANAVPIQNYLSYGGQVQQENYQDQASALGGIGSLFGSILGLGTGGGGTVGGGLFTALGFA